MTIELFDSHTHLSAKDFDQDREMVIDRARASGVNRMVTVGAGYGKESAELALAIAEQHQGIWASVGIHPTDAAIPFDPDFLLPLTKSPKVVAIGETGFDFYWDKASREQQEQWFRHQIELAIAVNKPLIIHCRQAASDCLETLQQTGASQVGGVFHCYSEDAAFAKELRKINFLVSFPGVVTFKKAVTVHEAVRQIPLEQIMIETDAPYLAPEPNRGKRCETAMVAETAKAIALLKGISFEEVARVTTATAIKFFKIT